VRKKYYYCDKLKGIELPVNALIIVILAVLVLLGILALYGGVWSPSSGGINLESAKNNGCHMLASTNCQSGPETIAISNFDANKNGQSNDPGTVSAWGTACPNAAWTSDNLAALCACFYYKTSSEDCKKLCGCQV
jgi:hypothetical protein